MLNEATVRGSAVGPPPEVDGRTHGNPVCRSASIAGRWLPITRQLPSFASRVLQKMRALKVDSIRKDAQIKRLRTENQKLQETVSNIRTIVR